MYSLKDQAVVVTGGAMGIGAAIVKEFLNGGAKVAILDLNETAGRKLAEELSTSHKDRVQFLKCDVIDEKELLNAFQSVQDSFGGLDVVFNNAGISDESEAGYKKLVAINYTAVVGSTMHAIKIMRKDKGGKGGTVINLSSIMGLKAFCPGLFVYGSLKNALIHFGRSIGMEPYYSRTGVRVLTMCVGITLTGILDVSKGFDQEFHEGIVKGLNNAVARGSVQGPEDVAKGMLEYYQNGASGSTWLVNCGVTSDITSNIAKAFEVVSPIPLVSIVSSSISSLSEPSQNFDKIRRR
ncbi:unnamed protein product [Leptosia nina]|uniref:15-hydroxyprostaglandin dehydrogenase [NAD(+)]-like n=1 Tax=Leptosia nina TaxID=320188 RepID=A0AAV1IVH6_9NEOP